MKKAALLAFVFVWTLIFFLLWQSFEGELPALIKVQLCLFYAVGFIRAAFIYEKSCRNTLPPAR